MDAISALRAETVEQQLDTINALAEALAAAMASGAAEHEASLRASLDRFVAAFSWNREISRPAIRAYAEARADGDDELFAPAFILATVPLASDESANLVEKLPEESRVLLDRLTALRR